MLMNEAEAKTKWCPMMQFVIGPQDRKWQGAAYTNRCQELNTDKVNCIASGCPMWRWAEDWHVRIHNCDRKDMRAEKEPERPSYVPKAYIFISADEECEAHWVEPADDAMARRRGYCGLAGVPINVLKYGETA